MKTISYNFWV